ncbi:MAG TPA: 30S ribosome-binding factor RbfA [Ktedonobacterales bacterium]|jgi:ribosome-binding factor A
MATKRRQDQLGEQIAEDLSDLIRNRMKDPRVGFASITQVELSADLRHAKVFVSVMGNPDEQKETMRALDHANGFLRHELAQRLNIRYTPDIVFRLDESIARGARVLELMRQVHTDEPRTRSESSGTSDVASPPLAEAAPGATADR